MLIYIPPHRWLVTRRVFHWCHPAYFSTQRQVIGMRGRVGANVRCPVAAVCKLEQGSVLVPQDAKETNDRVNYVTPPIVQVCEHLSSVF